MGDVRCCSTREAPELRLLVKFRRDVLMEFQLFPCFRVRCVWFPSWRYSDVSIASSNEDFASRDRSREGPGGGSWDDGSPRTFPHVAVLHTRSYVPGEWFTRFKVHTLKYPSSLWVFWGQPCLTSSWPGRPERRCCGLRGVANGSPFPMHL